MTQTLYANMNKIKIKKKKETKDKQAGLNSVRRSFFPWLLLMSTPGGTSCTFAESWHLSFTACLGTQASGRGPPWERPGGLGLCKAAIVWPPQVFLSGTGNGPGARESNLTKSPTSQK
jgi:hypothetical protein